jgi:twinkle protein
MARGAGVTDAGSESSFVRHCPCDACGSSDANSLFTDGHLYCYACGRYTPASGEAPITYRKRRRVANLLEGEVRGLRARNLTQETCEKFGYQQGRDSKGRQVQIAPYRDADRRVVAQKVRTKDKDFFVVGDINEAMPFGAHLWQPTGRKLVVTEGEIDAMTVSQIQGHKWPVVSISCGAGPQIKKYFAKHAEYFRGFDEVVLMFDMDDPGRAAARAAAEVLGARALIAELPLKDANEMLLEGRAGDVTNAIFRAKRYRPEGIRDLADLKDAIKQRPLEGLSWCFPTLTALTYGKRLGELVAIGAGTGVGKTDFLTQDMLHMVETHGQKIGVFALEQMPAETGIRLVGKAAERPLHIPESWDEQVFDATWGRIVTTGRVFLYDSFGVNSWDVIREKMEYLYHAEGVQYFYLDHLTALAAAEENEREGLEQIMAEMGGLVKQIPIHITFVSHLATPEGKPHEEGGRVMIRHFKGSRAIGFWSHFMLGLERDQQAEDFATRTTTTVRCLKDRYTGRSTGRVFYLGYDEGRGLLYETDAPVEGRPAAAYGFTADAPDGGAANTDF